uniref:Glyoxylate reductase/hydroxypyruvate reductase n=1 Tax=Glossina brevipalpis TaxID=37001 RepID=A0A1A9X1T6_9MUSC
MLFWTTIYTHKIMFTLANVHNFVEQQSIKAYKIYQLLYHSDKILFKNCSQMSNAKKSVYVTRPDVAAVGLDILKKECDVTVWSKCEPVPREELLKQIVGKSALFCALTEKIDKEVITRAGPQLKCIATISVGYEHIDLETCKSLGIRVGYTPDVLTDATAELTMALLLATSRRLFEANKDVYNGGWKPWSPNYMCGQGLKSCQVGLFGFGRIGQEIAARLVPFKPKRITYTTRNKQADAATKVGASYATFEEMISESDIIIVCCALTPETKEKFDKSAFTKMKKNCIFINTARGGIVDQNALYEVLKQKQIMAAGLDVTTPEPLPLDDPLLKLNNVVILPHIGSADIETRNQMSQITALNIVAALKDERMIAEV